MSTKRDEPGSPCSGVRCGRFRWSLSSISEPVAIAGSRLPAALVSTSVFTSMAASVRSAPFIASAWPSS